MSHRLQILVPEDLNSQIRKAAERTDVSMGEWVRRTIREALSRRAGAADGDPLKKLASLDAPTADIDEMIREIEAGRS